MDAGTFMKNPPFSIRPATNADSPAIQALVFGVLHDYGLEPDPTSTDIDLANIEDFYQAPNGYFGVLEENDQIVATLGLLRLDDITCELRKMYSLPSVRGRGIGRFLLLSAMNQAQTWGCQRLVLETASVLKEAIALYQQHGFREIQTSCHTLRCDIAMELLFV